MHASRGLPSPRIELLALLAESEKRRGTSILDVHEAWTLAQAAHANVEPTLQARIDAARRHIVELLEAQRAGQEIKSGRMPYIVSPAKRIRYPSWREVMLTPEIEGNLIYGGLFVPRALLHDLKHMLRTQFANLNSAMAQKGK